MTLPELKNAIKVYNAYFDELEELFVERSRIVRLLRLAMIQRQHMLVFGPPGTAKTLLCDTAFSGITGAEQFHTELSMFMAEDAVFGPYDVKLMREDGVLAHKVEGMLPEANLARLGEFLDASLPLQRSLLGALNERRFCRGKQRINMPLLTVFCDTNKDPAEFMAKNPYAWAVLDRLLFIASFDYLSCSESIDEMVERFQKGVLTSTKKKLPLELIRRLSELVVMPPTLIKDNLLRLKYAEAAYEYRQQRTESVSGGRLKVILPQISDRRIALASQMLEVGAVLDGRLSARPEDLMLPGEVLGTTEEEHNLWRRIAENKIEEIKEIRSQQLDHAQLVALKAISDQAEDMPEDPKAAAEKLSQLVAQVDAIVPDNSQVEERRDQIVERLEDIRSEVREKALKDWGLEH